MKVTWFEKRRQQRQYPLVIIFKEKHGDAVYLANNEEEFHGAFMEVFVRRYTDGYWFGDEDIQEYRAELDEMNCEGERAYFFLEMRSDWEYEGFDLIEPRIINRGDEEAEEMAGTVLSEKEATC